MSRTLQHPLSPQHSGSSTPSTFSSATNATWASSLASYPASMASGDKGKVRKLTAISPTLEMREPKMSSSVINARKHTRSSSGTSLSSPPVAFPAFDGTDEGAIAPLSTDLGELSKARSPSLASNSKAKIKPFLRKTSSSEKGSLDLSRSQVENEGLGIYTGSSNNMRRELTGAGTRSGHARSSSAVSQMSTTTTSSAHRTGAHYIHPMRQTPHTYTPPLARSHQNSRANSDDGEEVQSSYLGTNYSTSTPQPCAPLPGQKRPQMPLHVRTQTSYSRLHSSSQPNISASVTPSTLRQQDVISPDAPLPTARSSLESAFRMRSRSNTAATGETEQDTVARLRAEFRAKEEAKSQKRAQTQMREAEKEAKKQGRRDEAQRKRSRSRATSEKSVPLTSIEYSNTTALPVDEELEYIRKGEMPPPHVRTYSGTNRSSGQKKRRGSKAGRAASSNWDRFWFAFKTMWLKLKRGVGLGERR